MNGSKTGFLRQRLCMAEITSYQGEFITIYQEVYGEALTKAQAAEMAHRLLSLYALLARPVP